MFGPYITFITLLLVESYILRILDVWYSLRLFGVRKHLSISPSRDLGRY